MDVKSIKIKNARGKYTNSMYKQKNRKGIYGYYCLDMLTKRAELPVD